ncbi:MAG: hypothetical protein ACREEK_33580 [Bradyrhizobium sp.]
MLSKANDEQPGVASLRMGAGSWAVLVVLVALLGVAVFIAYVGWTVGGNTDVPASGYIAMGLGVIASLAVGFGLMALVFVSSRQGYDDPPKLLRRMDSDTN